MIEIKLKFTTKAFKAVKRAIMVQSMTSNDRSILHQFAKKVILAIDSGESEVQLGKQK